MDERNQLKIPLLDLLEADTRGTIQWNLYLLKGMYSFYRWFINCVFIGRWWIVGSSWSGREDVGGDTVTDKSDGKVTGIRIKPYLMVVGALLYRSAWIW